MDLLKDEVCVFLPYALGTRHSAQHLGVLKSCQMEPHQCALLLWKQSKDMLLSFLCSRQMAGTC